VQDGISNAVVFAAPTDLWLHSIHIPSFHLNRLRLKADPHQSPATF